VSSARLRKGSARPRVGRKPERSAAPRRGPARGSGVGQLRGGQMSAWAMAGSRFMTRTASASWIWPTRAANALAELTTEIPGVKLLLVGGGERDELERQARQLGVDDRLVFAGHRSDVPACMRAMDVVVHPSLSEAFSQVVIEAMASGTPLVSTDVGAAREVIVDGKTALLIPPADVGAIVDAVRRLHADDGLRRRLAASARESVSTRFTVERMVRRQLDCYRRWLGVERSPP